MLDRITKHHRCPAWFFRMLTTGLLLALAWAWLLGACDRRPELIKNPADTIENSRSATQEMDRSRSLSTELDTAIEQVADKSIPAVVHIEVTEHQELANPFLRYKDNPFFRRFFGLPKDMPKKLERKLVGIGSGVLIDAEGHILSNYHVVGGLAKSK